MADKPIGKDATGYEILTDAMKALLNQYPGLYENETIKFEELGKESGIAFSADNGALIYLEKENVCGTMHQVCQYPFYVVYRTASDKERQKLSVQKFLDNLGKWICREPVIINGSETRLNVLRFICGQKLQQESMKHTSRIVMLCRPPMAVIHPVIRFRLLSTMLANV